MKVDLKTSNTEACRKYISEYNPAKMLCTEGPDKHSLCHGDSGGPLLMSIDNGLDGFALLGLASFVTTDDNNIALCGADGGAGFFTRVSAYVSWIAETADLSISNFTTTNKTMHLGELDEIPESDLLDDVESGAESSSSGADSFKLVSVSATILAALGTAVSAMLF
ncbi:trypsin-like cysteine/serine peptidase domain-containing protein [Kickxella alabastrina]|uniref:trypsin-like cysteine/serine peptidase domain-containing protein n=1 Tax=Kickxella alabastrina TaxID=61397 RepID=UPI002220D2D8|nr:trypsin-like cysteine/serine peptidase domain-containing protein [Kickxella alabastrina]KAI7829918.1 trypsin-like cysteine/serine peptidase domain-containing protein [Kickxella alabastrina]